MDALSYLIRLARLQGSLDLRCEFSGAFQVNHAPTPRGQAVFHLVLQGSCVVESAPEPPVILRAGDLVLFPHGGAHQLREAPAHPPLPADAARAPIRQEHDGLLPVHRNSAPSPYHPDAASAALPPDLDLLCGRFDYAPESAALLTTSLPPLLRVSLAEAAPAATLHALVALMRAEAGLRQPGALAIITALSQALLTMALRAYSERDDLSPGTLALLADRRLGPSVRALLADPARAWTIASLGSVAAMSRATYARSFIERAGMAPGEFMTRLRMQIASDQLMHTHRRTGDIALAVGYQSEAAFGKTFRQRFGQTPARFRRQHAAAEATPSGNQGPPLEANRRR